MAQTFADIQRDAEVIAGKLPPLMVAADHVAATVSQGVHGRRRVGQGESFWQYRHYDVGDPIQQIDWRRSAKSDSVFVRENEWEAAQSVWIWADTSASMRYTSGRAWPEKAGRAHLLALALASLLLRGGEQIAPLGRGGRPSIGRVALYLLNQAIEDQAGGDVPGADSLPPVERVPRNGQIVLISDFLEPLEQLAPVIGGYADRGVDGHILQVFDPAEESLPFAGRTRFEGMENEGSALIGRVEGVRDDYRQTLDGHCRGLKDIARLAGWTYDLHITDRPPESVLLRLYTLLATPKDR